MTATPLAVETAIAAARAAADKKADRIAAIDVSDRLALTDIFLIASGETERQVGAIVDGVEEALHRRGIKAARREGLGANRWVLLDFGDIIVHVQHTEDREFYDLERLWRDCPVIELGELEAAGVGASEGGSDTSDGGPAA